MINVKDFEAIKARFMEVPKNDPKYDEIEQKYCGPGTGIIFNEDTNEIEVASGFMIDSDGNVVHK